MIHEVNCDRDWFNLLVSRSRTFDIRKDDRRFMIGDYVAFNECEHDENMDSYSYTGFSVLGKINYILNDERYVREGYIVIGFSICGILDVGSKQPVYCVKGEERERGGIKDSPYYLGEEMKHFKESERLTDALRELCGKYNIACGDDSQGLGKELMELPKRLSCLCTSEKTTEALDVMAGRELVTLCSGCCKEPMCVGSELWRISDGVYCPKCGVKVLKPRACKKGDSE